ncbi:MAG: phosphoribosylanthranilate isomerase [Sediminibacterium sp.]|nr:phosphoribosylanthranilate isomerase [Sediminibacterium sp.]MBX9778898.1 phosphoribosylanthranilate isomerase [Chitinophagaceae bacterium]
MRIKVCGLTNIDQFNELDGLGVDFGGFIFYHKSPRYVFKHLPRMAIKKAKGKNINKVGVFVNEEADEVLQTVDDCGLYLVQLHGDETPRYCEKISNYVSVIKAFRIREDDNIEWKIKDYQDAADMFLFDTAGTAYGGTGQQFNWEKLASADIKKPFFLSGGIGLEDVAAIQQFATTPVAKDLFSLDINSKFETAPGIKNIPLIENFIKAFPR